MTKIKKSVLCIVLSVIMALIGQLIACAKEADRHLSFRENSELKILHLTDWHTAYPMPQAQKQFVIEALAAVAPDMVVLGGDMSEASGEDQPSAVKEICDLMIAADVPFAITFGNHDYLHQMTIDELFALYKQYGGSYCLSVDEQPELFGCGTCSIPVYACDSDEIAYMIYCFDSGCEVEETQSAPQTVKVANHDSVHSDQIEWYVRTAEKLRAENGGNPVPSVVFQHIIPQEIVAQFFPQAKDGDNKNVYRFDQKQYKLLAIPNLSCIKDGYIMERPCPGYYNYGQLDAMLNNGDVRAIICGHDHSNSFTVNIGGIDIVNTPSVKPHSTFKIINWGGRVVTLHEDGTYDSKVLTGYELSEKSGSGILSTGVLSRSDRAFTKAWKLFVDSSMIFWKCVTKVVYGF